MLRAQERAQKACKANFVEDSSHLHSPIKRLLGLDIISDMFSSLAMQL